MGQLFKLDDLKGKITEFFSGKAMMSEINNDLSDIYRARVAAADVSGAVDLLANVDARSNREIGAALSTLWQTTPERTARFVDGTTPIAERLLLLKGDLDPTVVAAAGKVEDTLGDAKYAGAATGSSSLHQVVKAGFIDRFYFNPNAASTVVKGDFIFTDALNPGPGNGRFFWEPKLVGYKEVWALSCNQAAAGAANVAGNAAITTYGDFQGRLTISIRALRNVGFWAPNDISFTITPAGGGFAAGDIAANTVDISRYTVFNDFVMEVPGGAPLTLTLAINNAGNTAGVAINEELFRIDLNFAGVTSNPVNVSRYVQSTNVPPFLRDRIDYVSDALCAIDASWARYSAGVPPSRALLASMISNGLGNFNLTGAPNNTTPALMAADYDTAAAVPVHFTPKMRARILSPKSYFSYWNSVGLYGAWYAWYGETGWLAELLARRNDHTA